MPSHLTSYYIVQYFALHVLLHIDLRSYNSQRLQAFTKECHTPPGYIAPQSSFDREPHRPTHGPPPNVTRDKSQPSRTNAFRKDGNSFLRVVSVLFVAVVGGGDDHMRAGTTALRERVCCVTNTDGDKHNKPRK